MVVFEALTAAQAPDGDGPADTIVGAHRLLVGLALLDTPQFLPSLGFTVEAIWQMLPFFLLAVGIAGYIKAAGADSLIAHAFSGNPTKAAQYAQQALQWGDQLTKQQREAIQQRLNLYKQGQPFRVATATSPAAEATR